MSTVLERDESCIHENCSDEPELALPASLNEPGWYRLTYIDYYNRNVTRVHHVRQIVQAGQLARYGVQDETIVVTAEQWIPLKQISQVEKA